jgi:hypothetical protein
MAEIKKDLAYYWDHPDEYPRLKAEDLKYENTLYLCEFILSGIREEMENVIDIANRLPNDENSKNKAIETKDDLDDPFTDALTFGYGKDLVDELVRRCPKGVFERNDDDRKDGSVEKRKRHYTKRNVDQIRYQRSTSGSD